MIHCHPHVILPTSQPIIHKCWQLSDDVIQTESHDSHFHVVPNHRYLSRPIRILPRHRRPSPVQEGVHVRSRHIATRDMPARRVRALARMMDRPNVVRWRALGPPLLWFLDGVCLVR